MAIFGCMSSRKDRCWDYIESFIAKTTEESLQTISDLLLFQVENWLCASKFYKEKLKKLDSELLTLKRFSRKETKEREMKSNFNLFEDF